MALASAYEKRGETEAYERAWRSRSKPVRAGVRHFHRTWRALVRSAEFREALLAVEAPAVSSPMSGYFSHLIAEALVLE
jgi:hypothetical protein